MSTPYCSRCHDTGAITAQPLDDTNLCSYVFRCTCIETNYRLAPWQKIRRFPGWESTHRAYFVPVWEDVRPSKDWIIEQFDKKAFEDPIFKRRMEIWGRPWFVKVWEEYKSQKKVSLPNEESQDTTSFP